MQIVQLYTEGCQNLREIVKCHWNIKIKLTPERALQENLGVANAISDLLQQIRGTDSLSLKPNQDEQVGDKEKHSTKFLSVYCVRIKLMYYLNFFICEKQ